MTWHPIDTAPKDGTLIDLFVLDLQDYGWRVPNCFWHHKREQWKAKQFGGGGGDRLHEWTITHWMEIPAVPEEYRRVSSRRVKRTVRA